MSRRRQASRGNQPSTAVFVPNPKLKLLDQYREALRFWHYSYRTEQTYVEWIERFLRFCRDQSVDSGGERAWRHPRECGETEIQAFLSHLPNDRNVAASTQNQALNALVFLYREVLAKDLGDFGDFARAKRPIRLPAVLTREECGRLFEPMQPPVKWIAELLYGSGMRLMECLRLRIKDVDFARGLITVRSGKGDKDRVTMLPGRRGASLREQSKECHSLWESDRREDIQPPTSNAEHSTNALVGR